MDKTRLEHMLQAVRFILRHTAFMEEDEFYRSDVLKFAIIKQLEILGEAANFLSDELLERYRQVAWGKIVGARNIYVHEYFQISWLLVWEIIKDDIPELEKQLQEIINELNQDL